jgi:hypothetical protein
MLQEDSAVCSLNQADWGMMAAGRKLEVVTGLSLSTRRGWMGSLDLGHNTQE